MSNPIVKALEHAAEKLGKTLGKDAGKAVEDLYHGTGHRLKKVASNHHENDKGLSDHFNGLGKGGKNDPKSPHTSLNSGSKGPGGGRPGKSDPSLAGPSKGGQPSNGNIGCHTAGDPVDVVSGQMITNEKDLELPGLLPLVLRRAYASSYAGGRLFGPGWSSTLDQRVEVDTKGIHYAGDDAQILHYPLPTHAGEHVFPEAGARWPLTWDQQSDIISIEDPDGGWMRHFAPSGTVAGPGRTIRTITALTDRNDHRITFDRDETGTPTEVRHTGGYRIAVDTIDTPAGLRIESLRLLDGVGTGPGTMVVGYEYYPGGHLAGVVNSSGLPYEYEYDDEDRITSCTDRNGRCYSYVYDDEDRVVHGIGEGGHLSSRFHYDTAGRFTTVTDSLGHATEYHYDEQQHVTKTVDPLGNTTRTDYDEAGRVIARTDEINRTTHFDLDAQGNPIRITEPDGTTIELDYTELRQLAALRRGDTVLASFVYDTRGNVLTTTDASGARTSRQYDDQGRLVSVTDPLGQTRHTTTNSAGLITAIADAAGQTVHATYDAFGRVIVATNSLGFTNRFEYRTEGEIIRRVHPDGAVETWVHDPEGFVVEHRDQAGAVTRFEIGPFGKLAGRTLPDGEVQRFAYDTELQLLAVTMNGASWRYRYDEAGHLVGETDFNDHSFTYRLDGADQLLETIDAAGRTTACTYDVLGRLVENVSHDGTATALTYDDAGLLKRVASRGSVLEYRHDVTGRILSETVDGRTTAYTYDALGHRTSRTTPTGLVSTWTYDVNNQPTSLTNPFGQLAFAYDAGGRETSRHFGSGAVLTQSWDACGRLSTQAIWARDLTGGDGEGAYTNTQERTYGYRADGMPTVVTDRLRGRRDFELTPAGRITRVSAETWNESYAYDPLGNITRAHDTRMPDNASAGERAYSGTLLRSAGRTSYAYDDRGRLVRMLVRTLSGQRREWRYTWNAEDQLVRVDTPRRGSWTYTYDPLGRRLSKQQLVEGDGQQAAAEQTVFVWDGTQLIEQYSALADGSCRTLTWDWEPGTWTPVSQTERTWHPNRTAPQSLIDERFYAIVTDLTDTPSELVTLDGQIAWSSHTDTWGEAIRGTGRRTRACPLGRPGQYHDDESDLEYNYFRYYDPATGRYLSSDPLGLDGGPNPHSYVPNPFFWIDPLGLAKRQPEGWGGSHYSLRPSNWTDGSDTNSYERNHVPARAAYVGVGGTQLGYGAGPAIRMEYDDHRKFISTGSGRASDQWRADQRALIAQGKFDEAMKKDIDEIRRVHGTKYDAAIKEMADHLPHNKGFQKYLSDNGWKIRTCLLK